MSIDPTLLEGDLVSSARAKLMTAAASLIGTLIGKDATGDPFSDGWIFAGADQEGRPYRDPAATGKCAVVLTEAAPWGTNAHNTARMPSLQVQIYCDPSRDANGNIAARDERLKCRKIAKTVHRCFHDAANRDHSWPNNLLVVSSTCSSDLSITDVPNSDGICRGTLVFSIQLPG